MGKKGMPLPFESVNQTLLLHLVSTVLLSAAVSSAAMCPTKLATAESDGGADTGGVSWLSVPHAVSLVRASLCLQDRPGLCRLWVHHFGLDITSCLSSHRPHPASPSIPR